MADGRRVLIATERYARQMRFPPLGEEGQRRLTQSRALLCGCGALGSAIANTLVRAGVGTLRIVDRDFVELGNLQRQVLFDEADAQAGLPKAVAAAEKLRRINSSVAIEPMVADIEPANVEEVQAALDAGVTAIKASKNVSPAVAMLVAFRTQSESSADVKLDATSVAEPVRKWLDASAGAKADPVRPDYRLAEDMGAAGQRRVVQLGITWEHVIERLLA